MADIPEDTYTPEVQAYDVRRAVLIITADKVEDLEFFYPYYRFIEAGFRVDVATPDGGAFKGKNGLGLQDSVKVTDVDPEEYQLLYLPGGKAPEKLKKDEDVLNIVRHFVENGKPVAAVCHGPQILAAADVIEGRKIAAWPEIEDEVTKAGAVYVNAETVIDGPLITARWPADLPMHLKRTLEFVDRSEQRGESMASFASA